MKAKMGNIQLGKNKVTENFVESLKNHFKNHENMKISILKSGTRDKKEIIEMKDKILTELGKNYTARTIGFTIVVKKWRKPVR
ncbi:hypothetical protein COU59_02365 [Candidatus Pacearchaeota archaeon CG10_big_fil_rev_8_21_14_0_10_34_12]|nr:MAG: hypothetical protein COU59_02365 [Candidatus Pacearchaeota archaeon CG10_big_fil_rev_8_21_14_0_10_34_12]